MVYDPGRQKTLLFGGWGGSSGLNDTWSWNGVTWQEETVASRPPLRWGHGMAYDLARHEAVIFAGLHPGPWAPDTWVWDGSDWHEEVSPETPSWRTNHAMTYDAARGQIVLFGGDQNNSTGPFAVLNDTWVRPRSNRPPVAEAGASQSKECSSPSGAAVTLDGSASSDPDGDPITCSWRGPFGTLSDCIVATTLPLGNHILTLTVTDSRVASATDTVEVTVGDSTPPTITLSLSPTDLWPPNHKLVAIGATIESNDACWATPQISLVSVVSNEPDDGLGDGDTPNDIQDVTLGTDDRSFLLRAERSGAGTGRIYTAQYEAVDGSGNRTPVSAEVRVNHDQSKKKQ